MCSGTQTTLTGSPALRGAPERGRGSAGRALRASPHVATITLADSKDLKLVATRLGHSNENMVLRAYGHLLPGVDREAAQRLGELVKRRAQ
jgi:integrase